MVREREETTEAPGAAQIGIIGLIFAFALVGLIVILDLMTIHKHFIYMYHNMQHFYWRLTNKQPESMQKYDMNMKSDAKSTVTQ